MDSSIDSPELPHNDRAPVLIGAVSLVLSVATLAVGLRLYTRSRVLKQLGADDYLVSVAWMFCLVTGISQCLNTRNGLGKHAWDFRNDMQRENYLKGFYVSITLYQVCLLFVKLAFLMQYYRVFTVRKMRTTILVAMVIIGSWSLSQVLISILICDPVAGFWENSIDSRCIPNYPQWYINAAGNIATDLAIFAIPLPILVHLHLPKAQRLVLIGIFSLGFFTCAISVIRIKYLKQGGDFSYENVEGSAWSVAEICSGVTCACLPTLRPLVSKWIPSLSNRLHKPTRGDRRQSGMSCLADSERGSRHMRGNSDTSDMLDMKNREEFFCCVGLEARRNDSADGSDEGLEPQRTCDSLLSRGTSSPTPPAVAHIATRTHHRPAAYYNWMKSSVITEIGTGNTSRRTDSNGNISRTAIQVQRDVVMHEI
ncbi:hypothetical protein F4818DRAFT_148293 [Hypoxylon cercidicola]|nr:hypothetical protein F4818DRAFT_148293 [Hypoxylon cercidicola]